MVVVVVVMEEDGSEAVRLAYLSESGPRLLKVAIAEPGSTDFAGGSLASIRQNQNKNK